ncbi:MAG: sugar phosphate isomerase/epimerase [Clostridia bacterium]|nr:sugar phosphate isomerase/epimerase [Clostridia bacterium]
MKLSMETYGLRRRYGDFEAARLIREAGFDCVDYSCYYWKEQAHALEDGYREYARALRTHLDGLGLVCNQSHAPFDTKYGQPFELSCGTFRNVTRAIEVASILGAEQIVVHSIAMPKELTEDTEATHAYAMEYYHALLPFAEEFGIRIAVENLFVRHKEKFVYSGRLNRPDTLSRVVRELDSPWATACLDMGHAAMVGYEPENFVRGMDKGLLGAVHFQDGDYIEDWHTLPYLGQYHWAEIMKALAETGYRGDLTFEIYKYYQNLPDEAIPHALKMAEAVGRGLIGVFEGSL